MLGISRTFALLKNDTMKYFLFSLLFLFNIAMAQEAVLVTQEKNLGLITTIEYSEDGRYIAFGSEGDNKVKVFDVQSGKMIGTLVGHEISIKAVAFSPDGNTLVSGDKDGWVRIWNLNTWNLKDSVNTGSDIAALLVGFPTATSTMAGLSNGDVMKLENGKATEFTSVKGGISSLGKNGNNLAVGATNGRVYVYNESGTEQLEIKAHKNDVVDVKFTDAGEIISASEDGTVVLWSAAGDELKELTANKGGVFCMDYNPKNGYVITGGADKVIKLFNLSTGELVHEFSNEVETESGSSVDETVRDVAFSPDGNTIASSGFKVGLFNKVKSNDNVIRLWDVNRKQLYKTLEGEVNPIEAFCFHPTENKLVTMYNNELAIWDLNSGERFGSATLHERIKEKTVLANTEEPEEKKGGFLGNTLNKINDGDLIDNAIDNTVNVVEDKTEKVIKSVKKEEPYMTYSGQGNYFITYFPDDEIRLYSVVNGIPEFLSSVFPDQGHVSDITTDPNEKYIACAGSGEEAVSVVDCTTGKLLVKLRASIEEGGGLLIEAKAVSFSPDGSLLGAAFGNGKVRVWNTGSWSLAFESTIPGSLANTAFLNFSEDGSQLFVKTVLGITAYSMNSWDIFGDKTPKVKGQPQITHTPSNFLVTMSKDRLYFADLIEDKTAESEQFDTKTVSNIEINTHGYVGVSFLNGEFKLYDPSTGKEQFVMVGEGENVIFKTPENYYKVTKEGHQLVTFRVGKDAYPFEQFDAKYNRPDIVLRAMNSEDEGLIALYKQAYDKRLSKLGLTEADLSTDLHVPTASITNLSELPIVTDQGLVVIKVNAADDKYSLSSLHVWVNSVPIYGAKGKPISGETGFDVPVALGSGVNQIQVAVQNSKGAQSLKQTVSVEYSVQVQPSLYIVTVGTSEYSDSRYNLSYAAKDAEDLSVLAKDNSSGMYASVNELVLTNDEVVKGNWTRVREFLEQTTVNDIVILFVAGHGVLDDNFDYYYGTHDMDFENPQGTGLSYKELEGVLDGIAARKKVLIMDTCHSGEVEKDEVIADNTVVESPAGGGVVFRAVGNDVKEINEDGISPSKMMNQLFADIRIGTGATVITSAGGAEFAMESAEWKNGLFTYSLLFGLRNGGADINKDGKIMLSEIQLYTVNLVSELSGGNQVPTTRMQNIALDYQVW